MTEVSDGILSKIRGALALAEHEDTPRHEAEAAMAHAMRLMAQYGVERAMLIATNPQANVVGDRIVTVPAPYASSKMTLLNSIAVALGVKAINIQNRGNQEMHLFGLSSDLERVEMLFTSLLLQSARFMDADRVDNAAYARRPKFWTRDWLFGFTNTVYGRLLEAEERARAAAQPVAGMSTALVFVRRDELVMDAVAAKYPSLRPTKNRRRIGKGYYEGSRAGERADLGGVRMGGADASALTR